jgi:hypothetical protein
VVLAAVVVLAVKDVDITKQTLAVLPVLGDNPAVKTRALAVKAVLAVRVVVGALQVVRGKQVASVVTVTLAAAAGAHPVREVRGQGITLSKVVQI